MVELDVEEHTAGARQRRGVLTLEPRVDDLRHLLLQNPLRLGCKRLASEARNQLANPSGFLAVPLKGTALHPAVHRGVVVRGYERAVLEARVKRRERALRRFRALIRRQRHRGALSIAVSPPERDRKSVV